MAKREIRALGPSEWRSLLGQSFVGSRHGDGVRTYVNAGRELLVEKHRAGARGIVIVRAFSAMVDELLRHLFELAQSDYHAHYPTMNARCTMVAQGGYGRGELNPQSDVDLLFLYVWKVTPYVEYVTEKVLYALWDGGLQVGHATRTVAECVRLGKTDSTVQTAMLDGRFLCGDEQLFEEYAAAVRPHRSGQVATFVARKLEERRLRHERYGESVFLLEPDLKEGQGGLRDIQSAMWIAQVKCGVTCLDEARAQGLIDKGDLEMVRSAQDFLWRVRNELHFASGKHQDQLTFEMQELAAKNLGFAREQKLSEVETFMRCYYRHASEISRVTALLIHRAVEHQPSLKRFLQTGRRLWDGVLIKGRTLAVSPKANFESSPGTLLQLFVQVQKYRLELGQDSRSFIRAQAESFGASLANSAEANARFLGILRANEWIYETLQEMHRTNVLDALVPEFGRVRCMALHDLYHIYTVDQHLMRAVKEFERLRDGEFRESLPELTQLARDVENPEILILGILFHDIGKGQGSGHSELGSRLAVQFAERVGLNEDETEQLSFLVLRHLLLPEIAFKRDIEEESVVLGLADTMGSSENLRLLYVLTYSDMKAVGPDVWNAWRKSLLEELYRRAVRVLEDREKGEFERPDRASKLQRIRLRAEERLEAAGQGDAARGILAAMPDRYFLSTPEDDMPFHVRLLERLDDKPFLTAVRHYPESQYSEMVISARDQPGLFASITGVFASIGLDILSARIHTLRDGRILDVFRISHQGHSEVVLEPGKWSRLQLTLERVLRGEADVFELVRRSEPVLIFRRRSINVPTQILVDNEASEDFTIIEVYTRDRTGVLFRIAYCLHKLDLSIHLAKISTNVDQVADVFYVVESDGRKVADQARLEEVRATLYRALSESDDGHVRDAG